MESMGKVGHEGVPESKREIPPVTRFIIDVSRTVGAKNVESGEVSEIYDIGMSRNDADASASYYSLSDLSRTGQLDILIRSGDGTKRIDLPEDMIGRIATFIREDHAREGSFDCTSFIHFVNGIRYEFGRFIPEKWDMSPFDERAAVPGDSVMTAKDPEHSVVAHFALYLGEGLYLSKFGVIGKLAVTTLENMRKAFPGEYMFHIRPNEENAMRNADEAS